MISDEQVAHIRHLFHAEHWKIGTLAAELGLHPDTVRAALNTDRFRRHQQSPEGRLDHRDRQRTYRQRRRTRVTDQSSLRSPSGANLIAPQAPRPVEAAPEPEIFPSPDAELEAGWVGCQSCGRRGRWINPFPEVKHDF